MFEIILWFSKLLGFPVYKVMKMFSLELIIIRGG